MNNNNTAQLEPQPAHHGRTGFPVDPGAELSTTGDPMNRTTNPPKKSGGGRLVAFTVIVALIVVAVLLWQRSRTFNNLADATQALAVPTVTTTKASDGPTSIEIKLPGNLMAYTEASIYARTNGYVKSWSTDIGAHVKAGEVMAELEAPDVDAQLRQAKAALAQAQAQADIDQLNFNRAEQLLKTKVISQEEYDQNNTSLEAQHSAVQAAQANVQNLTVMQDFQKITAPFDGVVTRRDTDVGALINAGNGGGQELFHLARTDIMRVFINVPEVYSDMVKLDTGAWLELSEEPGVKVQGKVAHIAGGIDPATRTLQTEVDVPNTDGKLFPGAFAMVHLELKLDKAPTIIPVNTVIFRTAGTQVATVGDDNIVHLKSISVGRDFGTTYELNSGVSANDRLVLNPSDSLTEGTKVQVQENPVGTVTPTTPAAK